MNSEAHMVRPLFRFMTRCHYVFVLFLFLSGCAKQDEYTFQGMTMGTTYMVKMVLDSSLSEQQQTEFKQAIDDVLHSVNRKMSTYDKTSELSRLNQSRSTEVFPLSQETLEVIRLAREVSKNSNGAFDITVGPLVNAWGFGAEEGFPEGPDETALQELKARVGYEKLILEATGVRKTHPNLYCDLAAIAKGYGTDQVAELLERKRVENYLVEIGGEIRTRGKNREGDFWAVAIEKPDPETRTIQQVVHLSGKAIATSGDYRNFREVNGVRLSHTIDPKTGKPIMHRLASVSVIDDRCAVADAYATALMVLGPEAGWTLAEKENLAVLFILHDGKGDFAEKVTAAFKEYQRISKLKSP